LSVQENMTNHDESTNSWHASPLPEKELWPRPSGSLPPAERGTLALKKIGAPQLRRSDECSGHYHFQQNISLQMLPSAKRLHNYGKSPWFYNVLYVNQLFLWPSASSQTLTVCQRAKSRYSTQPPMSKVQYTESNVNKP